MFRIPTEKAFLDAFRPRDRKFVEVPAGVQFPMVAQSYFSWVDPSGVRVFMVFQPEGSKELVGIAFRRDQSGSQPAPAAMCEWCRSSGTTDEIGLVTADVNSKRRVGVNACLDLRCKEKLEDAANRAGRSVLDEARKMVSRMTRFTAEGLGISDQVREVSR